MFPLNINKTETLSEVFSYDILKTSEQLIRKETDLILEKNPSIKGIPIHDFNTFIGIEVEVEGLHSELPKLGPFWRLTEDGSLRNNGGEFVSAPIRGYAILAALQRLNEALEASEKHDFSDRTSVHIHVNVRDMTCESFMNFLLVYLIFESTLYKYVFDSCNRKRDENIFCVPISKSGGKDLGLVQGLSYFHRGDNRAALATISQHWKKYTGINLVPIRSFGTAEFRQLGGTGNIKQILSWINLILSIKTYACTRTYDQIMERVGGLNTDSMYNMFTKEIFNKNADLILKYNVQRELEKGVIFVKYLMTTGAEQTEGFDMDTGFGESSLKDYIETSIGKKLKKAEARSKKNLSQLSEEELESELLFVNGMLEQIAMQYRSAPTPMDKEMHNNDYKAMTVEQKAVLDEMTLRDKLKRR